MKRVIVGIDGYRITLEQDILLRNAVLKVLRKADPMADEIGSGVSPKKGVDWITQRYSEELGFTFKPFPPEYYNDKQWDDPRNWPALKKRNIEMAEWGEMFTCITVYDSGDNCYHCKMQGHHKRNGGCYTLARAAELGKITELIVV